QDAFEYQTFDTYSQPQHFNNGIPQKPPTPVSGHKGSVSDGTGNGFGNANGSQSYEMFNAGDINDEANRRGSNSDDDENMTPAQSRRKAQNRAA
ncbi:unnamed protein product, partial [Diplocarpon coronariae]